MTEVRLINAKFAQHIANMELSRDEAGIVQWVLSHTPTIDPDSLRPKGRWIYKSVDDEHEDIILPHCSECDTPHARERNFCNECGAKMEV